MRKLFLFLFCSIGLSNCHPVINVNSPRQSESSGSVITDKFKHDPFLDTLKRNTFQYFIKLAGDSNGLIPDRGPRPAFCSIAAIGFGLTAYIVGAENKYISHEEAVRQTLKTLRFIASAPQSEQPNSSGYKGFFYHFLDMKTGARFEKVELSTIDTGLMLMGILSSQSYFTGDSDSEKEIRRLAELIYERVDWVWAQKRAPLISMGWTPEKGFIEADYKGYCEAMFMYILALGSPTHAVQADSWAAFTKTNRWATFENEKMINFGPLFGHQYTQAWIDMRGIQDEFIRTKGIDYFENSRRATLSNQAYCIRNPKRRKGYSAIEWGLSACDGPGDSTVVEHGIPIQYQGYSARGAAADYNVDDGTIAPTAAGGSIAFAPEITIPALKNMKHTYGARLYGPWGFFDAFNPSYVKKDSRNTSGYFDTDYLGIDQGPILLMAENYQTEMIWTLMKKNIHIRAGLIKAGFKGGWLRDFE